MKASGTDSKWHGILMGWALAFAVSPMFAAGGDAGSAPRPADPGSCCASTPGCSAVQDPDDGVTVCRARGPVSQAAPQKQCRLGYYRCLRSKRRPPERHARQAPSTRDITLASFVASASE